MSGTILLLPIHAFMAWTGKTSRFEILSQIRVKSLTYMFIVSREEKTKHFGQDGHSFVCFKTFWPREG